MEVGSVVKVVGQVAERMPFSALPLHYCIPPSGDFKHMTAGETWYCKNMGKNSRPPRGKVYRAGVTRFKTRTWKKTIGNKLEFLPAL
jgi:hypothetical protein